MNKRHAKPTAQQLANRTYRRLIALEKSIATQLALVRLDIGSLHSGQHMLSERLESFRVLADHCARLLREKEALMKQVASKEWDGITPETAECIRDLMAPCAVAHLHRPGVVCGVCGT